MAEQTTGYKLQTPMEIKMVKSDSGDDYYNIYDAESKTLMHVTAEHVETAREIIRLANLGSQQ